MARFSKVLLLVMAGLVAYAPLAGATSSRVNSLGNIENYIADDVNLFDWYAPVTQYGNMVWGELGDFNGGTGTTDQMLGVANDCGRVGTFGMFLMDEQSSPWEYDLTGMGGPAVGGEDIYTKFVVRWGYDLENATIGLGFDRADQEEQTSSTLENHRSLTQFGGGVSLGVGDLSTLDLAASYGAASYERDVSVGGNAVKISEDDNTSINVRGRMMYDWKEDVQLVPFASFTSQSLSLKADSTAVDDALQVNGTNAKMTSIMGGVGMNVAVNGDNMLFFGAEIEHMKLEPAKTEQFGTPTPELKYLTLPKFYLALESGVTDWLTARVGGTHTLVRMQDEDDVTQTSGEFELTLGLGFQVADFDVDVELHDYAPYQLGYWLTGFQNFEPPVARATVSYHY
jgi:hypothetical protein